MDVLYRTISRHSDGWHVESIDAEDHAVVRIYPTRAAALAACAEPVAIPPPDHAEGGQVLASVEDDDDDYGF